MGATVIEQDRPVPGVVAKVSYGPVTDLPWWVYDQTAFDEVPTCSEFGIIPPLDGREADIDAWYCMREQLWAIKEGLA
jgi:hypothetical protein